MRKGPVHLIGLGGIGMSGLARLYLAEGYAVQGSDVKASEILTELEWSGVTVRIGHEAGHVEGAEIVVYSSSIPPDHPERREAERRGLRVLHRSEALASFCEGRYTLAVSGTHGKTTTTSLIGSVLLEAGRDPSIVVGGLVRRFGGNARHGQGREIVIEADESDGSFVRYAPDIAVVTNIEDEHLDHYGASERIDAAFADFVGRLKPGGVWIACAEDPRAAELMRRLPGALPYGWGPLDKGYGAQNIVECPDGRRGSRFEVYEHGRRLGAVSLRLMGRHNVLNALAAVAAGRHLGLKWPVIRKGLEAYEGAGRRFDVKYEDDRFLVVDDYAHHPTEIARTLEAARSLKRKRIVALFQPHRYSRTEALLQDFARCFGAADKLFITDIYAASESPRPGVTGGKVCDLARDNGHQDATFVGRDRIAEVVRQELRPGDLVISLGAGDISQVATQLSEHLRGGSEGRRQPLPGVRGRVLLNEPLSKHTTLKIGGPAQYWVEPEDEEDLTRALKIAARRKLPVHVFGAGSNLLAPDAGLKGICVHLGSRYFKEMRQEDGCVIARSGVPNPLFIQYVVESGFGGCEFLSGIPGNVGGAIAMNAGSHQQSVDARLVRVRVMERDGSARWMERHEVPFAYRYSGLGERIVLEGVFRFEPQDRAAVQRRLDEYRDHRQRTQDLRHPSAGCMFKNPKAAGCSSGKLIEDAGLKGRRIGDAEVSDKHANFIINRGGAKAEDVIALIREVRSTVQRKFGIELETEVRILESAPPAARRPSARSPRAWGRIAVLGGGISCEREVSLVSARAAAEALTERGLDVIQVDPSSEGFLDELKRAHVSTAFLALHGTFGEDGTVQRLLERAGIAYTGAGPEASQLCFDKVRTQGRLREAGVSVPDFTAYGSLERALAEAPTVYPFVVKPAKAGSSVGVSLVRSSADREAAFREAFKYSDEVLVETYIRGRELTVGLLGGKALPVVEVVAGNTFYDYEAKYKDSRTRYEVPAALTPRQSALCRRAALAAWAALGCQVMARIDLILGEDGRPYVLDVNTLPGLTPKSLLPKAARAAGIEFGELCVRILQLSRLRMAEAARDPNTAPVEAHGQTAQV
ncbi:MAG: UDP-N-acetylmuramate--L-alanine ligase [Candidatus Omnitrophica bacterium]|nr:UDP-N-acetylmuramate--L-alanine ligase [Candidatus Omnitrophota bacterium]